MDDETLTQAEAARLLGLTRARVAQLVDDGTLPAVEEQVSVRKVKRSDVERYLHANRRPGRPRKAVLSEDTPSPSGAGGA